MKQAWVESCSETIQTFVERSTRLQADKLCLTLVEKIDFDYQISLSFGFRIDAQKESQAGRVKSNSGTKVFYHAFQYREALQAESIAVLSRSETLSEVHAQVLSLPYGAVKKDTTVYSHPVRLCLTEGCTNCHGRGQINCTRCYGSGRNTCSGCGGSGQVLDTRSHYDHYTKQNRTESYYRSCYTCNSSGKVSCHHCNGSGDQRCSPCEGTGETTLITRLSTIAAPSYQLIYFDQDVPTFIKDGLYKAGIPELEKYGAVRYSDSKIDEPSNRVNIVYNAEVPFARLTSPLPQSQIADQQIQWIIYGVTPQILDSGHVIELMLKSDLNNLVYQASRGKLLSPWVATNSRKTLSTFMESEAHQEMLDANRAGQSGESLREALNRGFTSSYLDEALANLKALMQAIQNWSVVKWALFSAVIIYLLIPFYAVFNRVWSRHWEDKRLYFTPLTRWANQQELAYSLLAIIRSCGLFIAIVALLVPALGYLWRRYWVYWRIDKHLAGWAVDKGILCSRWLISLLLTSILSVSLLFFFPVWMTNEGLLFGKYPLNEFIYWLMYLMR